MSKHFVRIPVIFNNRDKLYSVAALEAAETVEYPLSRNLSLVLPEDYKPKYPFDDIDTKLMLQLIDQVNDYDPSELEMISSGNVSVIYGGGITPQIIRDIASLLSDKIDLGVTRRLCLTVEYIKPGVLQSVDVKEGQSTYGFSLSRKMDLVLDYRDCVERKLLMGDFIHTLPSDISLTLVLKNKNILDDNPLEGASMTVSGITVVYDRRNPSDVIDSIRNRLQFVYTVVDNGEIMVNNLTPEYKSMTDVNTLNLHGTIVKGDCIQYVSILPASTRRHMTGYSHPDIKDEIMFLLPIDLTPWFANPDASIVIDLLPPNYNGTHIRMEAKNITYLLPIGTPVKLQLLLTKLAEKAIYE